MRLSSAIILTLGCIVALWAGSAMMAGIMATGGVFALAGQYMEAVGMVKPLHTLVDYYTHIKGIEYLICVAFFVAFPVFFKYVNTSPTPKAVTA